MDEKARSILLSTYWGSSGWKQEKDRVLAPGDLDYARAHGVMFSPLRITHDDLVSKAVAIRELTDSRAVADAFVLSLTTRQLEYRSALGSYAVLRFFPQHDWSGVGRSCEICGCYNRSEPQLEDLNVLNFERLKWGGVRHSQPLYAAFDLELFARMEHAKPNAEHIESLRSLLRAIASAPPRTTSAELQRFLAKSFTANKAEREVVIGVLGLCGVLGTNEHPGFQSGFIPASERLLPHRRFVDVAYPACWWKGSCGINEDAVHYWFGHLL